MTVKTSGGRTQIVHEAFEAWLFVSVILGALGVVAVIVFVVREVAPGRDPQLPSSK
jgi:asparagine N-glycosylation enzyme membrane subunit Stt3